MVGSQHHPNRMGYHHPDKSNQPADRNRRSRQQGRGKENHAFGMLDIEAQNVTIENSVVVANSGKTGEDANGTGAIKVEDGASAVISHVKINGDDGVHACIWHEGTSLTVNAVNCSGSDDGIFS